MSMAYTNTPTRADDCPEDHVELDVKMSLRAILGDEDLA